MTKRCFHITVSKLIDLLPDVDNVGQELRPRHVWQPRAEGSGAEVRLRHVDVVRAERLARAREQVQRPRPAQVQEEQHAAQEQQHLPDAQEGVREVPEKNIYILETLLHEYWSEFVSSYASNIMAAECALVN